MGIHVQAISHQIEARDLSESPDTWAYVVHNVEPDQAQTELDAMRAAAPASSTGRIFISAVSRSSVTVSGPPSRLKGLFLKSKMFRDATSIPLPVYGGLCHAPHLYGRQDTTTIVHGGAAQLHANSHADKLPVMPLHSTSTGAPYLVSSGVELLESVVTELLTQAIKWDTVISNLVSAAEKIDSNFNMSIGCFGNSIPLRDLEQALQESLDGNIHISHTNYIGSLLESAPQDAAPRGTAQSKLAIVGMSCRLPGGATDTEKFWELLESGLDVSREIPADRFDIETHFDADGKDMNKTMTKYGCFIDDPASFDAAFFNMSPREALAVDPQMRLSMVTAYEALERSGFVANRTLSTRSERIGTYYGQAADDYREVNQGQEVGTYYIPGGCRAFGPGRINYFFKFAGPSYSIDTACSSGLAAIEVACQALWNGDVDMAVAGGVNILTNPDGFTGLCKGHFLTKTHNACKTWDASADGYCRADGVGSVVIKRLEDAQADNDPILGVVLSAGTNHSAEAVSITHPHAGHQSYLSRQVLRQAGINPLDVSYVELHGTGTQAGDFEEMQGVLDVYAPDTSPRRRSDQPLHIGSCKANIGHGESVAGTTALIKVLLMLQKNAIPPHIGIKTEINPRLPTNLDKRNCHIPFERAAWPTSEKKRLAAVNNFGAAGGNTMMILEEAPRDTLPRAQDPRPTHVIALSAKTKGSLANNIKRFISHLDDSDDEVNLADLAYTTTARKYQHSFRVAITASSVAQVKQKLISQLDTVDALRPVGKSGSTSVAFAMTGQGASHQSMNLELYRDAPAFREQIQHLDAIAQAQGFPSFIPALDGSFPSDHVHPPVITQLALVCTEIALAHYWSSLGIVPDIVIGHSLGEYAAMQVAGVISANDAIFMVGTRAQMLMDACESGSHCMLAVKASLAAITDAAQGKPHTVACVNGLNDTVLSGTKEEMDDITITLEASGFRCIKLPVAFAFHSEQMDPILDDFEAACKSGVLFHEPKLPVISPLLGKVVCDGRTFNANYARRATRETVDFVSALESAADMSIGDDTVWIEIGPHPVCAAFIKSTLPSTRCALPSIRRGDDNWKTLSETLSTLHLTGIGLNWSEFHSPFEDRLRTVDLPTYAWDEKKYWMQYNGDWCLTKGNTYYHDNLETTRPPVTALPAYEFLTSSVQKIIDVEMDGTTGTVVMQSDLMQKDFLAAAHGHRMNDCGVVTSVSSLWLLSALMLTFSQSIHADIAYTLGEYLYRKFYPNAGKPDMNVSNLVVTKGLVAQKGSTTKPQLIQVTAHTTGIHSGLVDLTWQNVHGDGTASDEPFATATLAYGQGDQWLASWAPMAHLVQHRIAELESLATQGRASRLSRNMAYTLFGKNLVDYAEKYRGMQSVVIAGLEAFADVELSTKEDSAKWTVPPYFIDSVAHLAGFIMNCSDDMDTANNYCVTPGWGSMRFAEPLLPGGRYRSYVKMIPTKEDPQIYAGDVYILRADDSTIVGMVGAIMFRRFPRLLLNRFFTAPYVSDDTPATPAKTAAPRKKAVALVQAPVPAQDGSSSDSDSGFDEPRKSTKQSKVDSAATTATASTPATSVDEAAAPPAGGKSMADKALDLVARETALNRADLQDSAEFAGLGVDSLMSLVLAEKFRIELDVKVNGSLFLDYPTVGDMRKWLDDYY